MGWGILASTVCSAQELPESPTELSISLRQALALAFSKDGNAAVQLSRLETKKAEAQSREALSVLLPNLYGTSGLTDYTESFAAQGFTLVQLPFGLKLPQRLGPLDAADVRAQLNGNLFDFSAIRRFQASQAGTRASKSEVDSAMESVAAQVARQYMAMLRAAAEVDAAEANVKLGSALVEQARRVREAGNGVALDVTRAQVELAEEQQRLQAANGDLKESQFNLLRTMRLSLDTQLHLTDRLEYIPVDPLTLTAAKSEAKKLRPDLQAETERQNESRLALSATRMQRLPSIVGYANYGTTGNAAQALLPTYALGISLRLPVYDGGRQEAQAAESLTQYREESVRVRDLNDQIDLEIRTAIERLQTAELQFKTATSALALAETELDQTSRRYAEGVAGSIEVTDAQTKLARAQDNRIAALFSHNLARIDLNYAMGSLVRMIEE
jgi:outer membrane protein